MHAVSQMELINMLSLYPDETEWIEFKEGNSEPTRIGRDISALANAAAYHGRPYAYKIWGVEDGISDGAHRLVGTSFNYRAKRGKGNQDLLLWLRSQLSPNASYEFSQVDHEGLTFVVLTVRAAAGQPVCFDRAPYIREGSSTTRLEPGSAKERELWRRLQRDDYELDIARRDVPGAEIGDLLDIVSYYDLLRVRKPASNDAVLRDLCEQELARPQDNGRYSITNLGALLVARELTAFPGLRRRVLRVVRYSGKGSFDIVQDASFDKGYALAMPEAERYILTLLPTADVAEGAFRRARPLVPQTAVREMLSNTLIHQDLSDATAGPLVGVYDNRIEFSNPGMTLMPSDRVLNAQPKTRNGTLARIMRQMDLCEEGGTGWDRTVAACEQLHLPAPRIRSEEQLGTKVTLFGEKPYERMTKAERMEAVYWHACLMYAQDEPMGNQSLRERFGLEKTKSNTVAISRLIRDCCQAGLVRDEDESAGARYKRYIPAWA